jgi:hypothetical protein
MAVFRGVEAEPMTGFESLPLADPGREESAKQLFPYKDTTPEEYVARFSHTIGCSSFGLYRYRDRELEAWVHQAHRLLADAREVERCRKAHLTPDELQRVRQDLREPF